MHVRDEYSVIQELLKLDMFIGIDYDAVSKIADLAKYVEYSAGESIIHQGEYDCWIFFLMHGSVKIIKDGKTISHLRRKGDTFGEIGVIDGLPRSAAVIAGEDWTRCIRIDPAFLDRLCDGGRNRVTTHLYRAIAESIANKLRTENNEVVRLQKEVETLKSELHTLRKMMKEQV